MTPLRGGKPKARLPKVGGWQAPRYTGTSINRARTASLGRCLRRRGRTDRKETASRCLQVRWAVARSATDWVTGSVGIAATRQWPCWAALCRSSTTSGLNPETISPRRGSSETNPLTAAASHAVISATPPMRLGSRLVMSTTTKSRLTMHRCRVQHQEQLIEEADRR